MDSGANSGANSDLCFLQDEKFDFDVSLSPASSKAEEDEGDDEVFVGPVSQSEQCASTNLSCQPEEVCGVWSNWTPLTGDQLEAVCKEAHSLASQLQRVEADHQTTNMTSDTKTNTETVEDEFVQDTEVKLGILAHAASALSPIKRQTFCVHDSPMKQLPPAVQRQLLKGSSSSRASSSLSAARLSTSSPMVGARPQLRTALRGKATLRVAAVLPSKPLAPPVSHSASKSRPEKTRLQPPSTTAGISKQSPSSRPINRVESSEDLLSDSVSVTSDTSDCSFNSSLLGKRTLVRASKNAGLRKPSGVKAPPTQSRRVTDRRNTSSSSSSVSSFNSSLSLSPGKGKLNSSLNQSLSSSTRPAPSSIHRPRRSAIITPAEPLSSSVSSRSHAAQAKKLLVGDRAKLNRSTPLKRADSTPIQPTPPKRMVERTMSVGTTSSVRLTSGVKAKPKPGGQVHPTPNMSEPRVQHANGIPKVLKPNRLSVSSTDSSRLQKLSAGSPTPSVGSCKPQQLTARRPSGLPTPVKRRTSTFQAPSNQTRTFRPPSLTDSSVTLAPSSAKKQSHSPVQNGNNEEELVHYPDIQPFCLGEVDPAINMPSNCPEAKQAQNSDLETSTVSETVPTSKPITMKKMEQSPAKTQEVLLLDLPPPALQFQEKLLIDLANTPDLIRTDSKSCSTTQLIDLSSPLIKWSPEEKKENSAPLINLSF